MGNPVLNDDAYLKVKQAADKAGSATHLGKERMKQGKGLNPLVDPSANGLIRRSLTWYEPTAGYFLLLNGVAIAKEDLFDTTGSFGETNVAKAMESLPHAYDLLQRGKNAVLGRYNVQIATSIFGDTEDKYILNRSEFEKDDRIAIQMTMMYPENGGAGNQKEDPQYGLFGAAYLTQCSINRYGLKRYHFTTSDEPVPDYVRLDDLIRVFGPTVFEKCKENWEEGKRNGFELMKEEDLPAKNNLPATKQIISDLLKGAHAFFFQVGDRETTTKCWPKLYGKERVIYLPDVSLLAYYEAAIIGLTEGTLTLQNVEKFLMEDGGLSKSVAVEIKRGVAHIPIGAQMMLPNFNKIPLTGAKFAKKGDLWPMESTEANDDSIKKRKKRGDKEDMWA